jgi:hypothetical protein
LTDKERLIVYVEPKTREQVESTYKGAKCRSMSEFVEEAVLFYIGYLKATEAEKYLPKAMRTVLAEKIDKFEDRMARLMFKYAVEQNISNHILAADTDLDLETYDKLRARCVREVRETNGSISFKDDLKFQKSL